MPSPDPTGPPEQPTLPPSPPAASEEATLAPAGPPGDLPGQFGRYRIEKQLGQGGMGAVYLAHDTLLGRRVALKVPVLTGPAEVRARFLREAQAAARLQHPNICPIHDLGEIDGIPYLTMAFIDGEPLSRRIAPGRPFEPHEAAALVRKLALALDEAHRQGIIHRDLKPGNVMIDGRGEPVIMDFGLARLSGLAIAQLTQQGDMLGTPAYMPPEQVNGDVAAMGPASDVWSLGVVLYELLTGARPFEGDMLSLISQITLDDPPPPSSRRPGLDPRLDAVCLRALARKPADRWPSMRHFADALADLARNPAAAGPAPEKHAPAGAGAFLTLRVEGTPYAYGPLPGQDVITVGRQKRRPGDPPDHGNDLVVRVPGNDTLSARISRRHLEVHRTPEGFAVIDRSKAGTLHNGRPLARDAAVPLQPGDRLVLAGVITLQVVLAAAGRQPPTLAEVSFTAPAGGNQVVFEATCGDMVTAD
jgi:serine/threonine protein kinase